VLVLVGQIQNHESLSRDGEHMNPHEVVEHPACRRVLGALAFLVRKCGLMLLQDRADAVFLGRYALDAGPAPRVTYPHICWGCPTGSAVAKERCRVGREVAHPGPSPDPDERISRIRLFRRCDAWLRVSTTFRSAGDMSFNVKALDMDPS
jgi:hypothetical protein